jgi:hypothetical protein
VAQRQAKTKKAPGFPLGAGTFRGNCPLLSPIFWSRAASKALSE